MVYLLEKEMKGGMLRGRGVGGVRDERRDAEIVILKLIKAYLFLSNFHN